MRGSVWYLCAGDIWRQVALPFSRPRNLLPFTSQVALISIGVRRILREQRWGTNHELRSWQRSPRNNFHRKYIDVVRHMVEKENRAIYDDIQAFLGIGMCEAEKIPHDHLGVTKVCTRWLPQNLTASEKRARVNVSEQMLVSCLRHVYACKQSCLRHRNSRRSMDLLLRAWNQTPVGSLDLSRWRETNHGIARAKRWSEIGSLFFLVDQVMLPLSH